MTEGFVPDPAPASAEVNVTASYAYTPAGNVESITDPKGAVMCFVYDLLGSTTQETNPLGKTWDCAYDALSCVTSEVDGKNPTTTNAINNFLRRNPDASPGDVALANRLKEDLTAALNGE